MVAFAPMEGLRTMLGDSEKVAREISAALSELAKRARAVGLTPLAYLLDVAKNEADDNVLKR